MPCTLWLDLTRLPHTHQSDRSDKLVVTKTGTHGLSELRAALDDSKASYGYARVTYSNDKESQREKFILVVWIGSGCKVMRKAKVGLPVLRLRATPHVSVRPSAPRGRFFPDAYHTPVLP